MIPESTYPIGTRVRLTGQSLPVSFRRLTGIVVDAYSSRGTPCVGVSVAVGYEPEQYIAILHVRAWEVEPA